MGKGSAELGVKVTKDQTDKFNKAVEQTTIVTIGSKPPADGELAGISLLDLLHAIS